MSAPSEECNLILVMSGGDMLGSCPNGGCGADECFEVDSTSMVTGIKLNYCKCEGDDSQAVCNTRVKVKDEVVTINCANPCLQSCDVRPITETPSVPCFCDN